MIVVRRGIGGLYEEDILTTDTILVVDREFAVCEMLYLHITEVNTQASAIFPASSSEAEPAKMAMFFVLILI